MLKVCIKCRKEKTLNKLNFNRSNHNKDSFTKSCKECLSNGNNRYSHISSKPRKKRKVWSEEDNLLFMERYPNYLNSELIELFYQDMTEKQLWDKANRHGVVKSENTNKRRYTLHSEKMYGIDSPLYNRTFSNETIDKMSKAIKRRYEKSGSWLKGIKKSEDQISHMRKVMKKKGQWEGDKNPNWQGGTSTETKKARNSYEYLIWRRSVLDRDDRRCQRCASKEKLEAHHIKPFNVDKSLRYDIDNGITLCEKCHSVKHKGSFHNIYGTYGNTKEQLYEYFTGICWDTSTRKLDSQHFLFGEKVEIIEQESLLEM